MVYLEIFRYLFRKNTSFFKKRGGSYDYNMSLSAIIGSLIWRSTENNRGTAKSDYMVIYFAADRTYIIVNRAVMLLYSYSHSGRDWII